MVGLCTYFYRWWSTELITLFSHSSRTCSQPNPSQYAGFNRGGMPEETKTLIERALRPRKKWTLYAAFHYILTLNEVLLQRFLLMPISLIFLTFFILICYHFWISKGDAMAYWHPLNTPWSGVRRTKYDDDSTRSADFNRAVHVTWTGVAQISTSMSTAVSDGTLMIRLPRFADYRLINAKTPHSMDELRLACDGCGS